MYHTIGDRSVIRRCDSRQGSFSVSVHTHGTSTDTTNSKLRQIGKKLGVVDGYLEKREERKKKERAPPKAAFSNTKKRKKEASFVQI